MTAYMRSVTGGPLRRRVWQVGAAAGVGVGVGAGVGVASSRDRKEDMVPGAELRRPSHTQACSHRAGLDLGGVTGILTITSV